MIKSGHGGASNELGSLHRSGIAAMLAIHGLVGRQVSGAIGAIPVRIHLEADTNVDDIVATMGDESKWYIQCKRSAGNDAALRAAIDQWLQQDITPKDRVVLASRSFHGILKNLQNDLDQWANQRGVANGIEGWPSIVELLKVIEQRDAGDASSLLPHVRFIEWAAEFPVDQGQAYATALLADSVVSHRDADAAFEALRNFMQHKAAAREWSQAEDWLDAIRKAGIATISSADGVPGAQVSASQEAISAYRHLMASAADTLDLSLLSPKLGALRVDNLLEAWSVKQDSTGDEVADREAHDLWNTVRRNARLCITGHPGMGKSVALQQIAARMAADTSAPLPILIDLRRGLDSAHRDDITLHHLLELPSQSVPGLAAEVLHTALHKAVLSGDVAFLVDGLDETRRNRGVVASALRQILDVCKQSVGLVQTTRPSAEDAVSLLSVPVVRLQTPKSLTNSLDAILERLSKETPTEGQIDWLTSRRLLLKEASKSAPDIWRIPLLATLAALRIGSARQLTTSPADLLEDVISASVSTWEELKSSHRDGLDQDLRSEMLVDGFTAIGRLLWLSSRINKQQAIAATEEVLADWTTSKRMRRQLAEDIVKFWDERVGIFVVDGEDMFPRNRQFAELAAVKWVAQQPTEIKRIWMRAALEDGDRMHTVELAARRDPVIRDHLIDFARRGDENDLEETARRSRASSWVSQMWHSWSNIGDTTAIRVLNVLSDAAVDALPSAQDSKHLRNWVVDAQRRRDGQLWTFVLSMIRVDLSADVTAVRLRRLNELGLSSWQQTLVDSFLALRQAATQGRPLTPNERALVGSIVFGPTPEKAVTSVKSSNAINISSKERFVSGVGEILSMAAARIEEFSSGAADAIYEKSRALSMHDFETVNAILTAKGLKDPHPYEFPVAALAQLANEFKDYSGLGWVLRALAASHQGRVAYSQSEEWRRRELLRLIELIKWGKASIPEWREAAAESPHTHHLWFASAISTYGLDPAIIASEASALLAAPNESHDFLELAAAPALHPEAEMTLCDIGLAAELTSCFTSSSQWVLNQTFGILWKTRFSEVTEAIHGLDDSMTWWGRFYATIVAITNVGDQEAEIIEASRGDGSQRAAAGAMLIELDRHSSTITARLATDEDATVRYYSGGDVAGAERYTCTYCYEDRDLKQVPCPACKKNPVWINN
ncbi:NACHT domain-containing protein [Clavibacter michiganensis]|uniref:NACHT domain-containing protein n=1 Tax=Clavibacter michiganensis TaxID=28447 RepID=UPI003DA03401